MKPHPSFGLVGAIADQTCRKCSPAFLIGLTVACAATTTDKSSLGSVPKSVDSAVARLDTAGLAHAPADLVNSLRLVREGDVGSAADVVDRDADPRDANAALRSLIRASLLVGAQRWDRLALLDERIDPARLRGLAALRFASPERYTFAEDKSVLKLDATSIRTPLVEGFVGGRKLRFWIDTGAGFTILNSEIAKALGIHPLAPPLQITTATTATVPASPAILPVLRVGSITVENHPVLIVDSKELQVESFWGLARIFDIQGMLGWNFIRNIDIEFNVRDQRVVLRNPGDFRRSDRNLFWLGSPYFAARSESGAEILFGIDTGAAITYFTPRYTESVGVHLDAERQIVIQGVGGARQETIRTVKTTSFVLNGKKLYFADVVIRSPPWRRIVLADGILGADILSSGVLRLNWPKGRITFQPYRSLRALD